MPIPMWVSSSVLVAGTLVAVSCNVVAVRSYTGRGLPADDVFFIIFYSFLFASGLFLYLLPAGIALVTGDLPGWGLSGHMKRLAMFFGALVLSITSLDAAITRAI